MTTTESALRYLLDTRALDDLIHRQALAVDRHEWDVYRACMDDEVTFDFRSHTDDVLHKGVGIVRDPAIWVEAVSKAVTGFDATQHIVTNIVHTIDGDRSQSVCFVLAEHILNNNLGDRSITVGVTYTIGSVRRPSGWKIKEFYLKVLWYKGNISLYELAARGR
jgi:hypothetical protein